MKKMIFCAFFSFLFLCAPAFADAVKLDDHYFKRILVQDAGRIKPLDTFASSLLYTISGKRKIDGLDANTWLMETIFAPDKAEQRNVIFVKDDKLLALTDLPARETHLYSLAEVRPALKKTLPLVVKLVNVPEATRTVEQNALLDLHERSLKLAKLTRSFTFTEETDIFRVIPRAEEPWTTPWQAAESRTDGERVGNWLALMKAYSEHNAEQFKTHSKALSDHNWKTRLEIFYHTIQPFKLACLFYAFALLFLLIKKRYKLPFFMPGFAAGVICHTAGILMRMLILERPPVGTLYESILFVALICVMAGALFRARTIATATALGLLLLSFGFIQDGDTLSVLTAVLNTNFWLATHVLCITAGYGAALIAGCMGHYAIHVRTRNDDPTLRRTIYKATILALLLTAVGTLLGGIWADQSWGRFWGWDPKENGALLLTLWLAWLLHGRQISMISDKLFHAGVAATNIIVALSWFGVNLLGVGLHSYGFTTGVGLALALFCASELLLIGFLYKQGKINA
ncbi:MAG: hypothetical protein GC136_06720 [Alphaproteobacteria bacterium]|nr:hypothetical protein [Alphaproteobacteria bacterium]